MKRLVSIAVLAAMAGISSFAELPLFPGRLESKFDGLFGLKFGERIPSSASVVPSPDGTLVSPIEPKAPEFVFQEYYACILPQTRVIVGFCGVDSFASGELEKCTAAYGRCRKAVEARFGKKMTDASSSFDATKPDEDGEQIFKVSMMTFPNSLRIIEVHCLKDVDDKVFRVRIKAYDQSLLNTLDSEKKALKREKDDATALDAL